MLSKSIQNHFGAITQIAIGGMFGLAQVSPTFPGIQVPSYRFGVWPRGSRADCPREVRVAHLALVDARQRGVPLCPPAPWPCVCRAAPRRPANETHTFWLLFSSACAAEFPS